MIYRFVRIDKITGEEAELSPGQFLRNLETAYGPKDVLEKVESIESNPERRLETTFSYYDIQEMEV